MCCEYPKESVIYTRFTLGQACLSIVVDAILTGASARKQAESRLNRAYTAAVTGIGERCSSAGVFPVLVAIASTRVSRGIPSTGDPLISRVPGNRVNRFKDDHDQNLGTWVPKLVWHVLHAVCRCAVQLSVDD